MIGDNIRKALEIKGITSNELAKKIDVSATYISYLLNNKRNAGIKTLEKIAKVLGCKVSDLFDGKEVSTGGETEEDKDLNSFAQALIKQLLAEKIISDPENIPSEITDMIIAALKLDIKRGTKHKE